MRLLLLLALPHALALRTAGAGAAGSRPTEASKAAVLVEGMMQRQERLRECTRCWLPLDLCLCADGRIQTGVTSRVDVVVAMHYKEYGKKKNTAKLLPLALQHGQSAPSAAPQLGPCASSGRAWRHWAARYSQEEADPLGSQPLPRVLERATSKVADFTAFDHPGVIATAWNPNEMHVASASTAGQILMHR